MTIYSSHHPSPALPRCSIFDYLFPDTTSASAYPVPRGETVAFVDGLTGAQVTRQDVKEQAQRLAGGLHGLGLRRGDCAVLFGTNSLEWLNAIYGMSCLGMKVSPVNYAYTPPELLHQLKHSSASVVFISPHLLPVLHEALKLGRTSGFRLQDDRVILLCPPENKGKGGMQYKAAKELWGKPRPAERFQNGQENDTAYLCYSSGTTGVAKGVETTHYNMTSQLQAFSLSYEPLVPGKDVVLGYLPFSHMYGLQLLVHHPLINGVPVVVLPRFEEKSVLAAIERYRVTWALVVPPVLIILLQSALVDRHNVSSLRGMMSAAAPLSESLCKAVEQRFPGCRITQGYGLTETTPIIHCLTLDEAVGRQGSIGRLLSTFEARLVDPESGKDVSNKTAGELWVRGPSVMKGYLNNPTATTGTFAKDEKGGERWFKTGDMAVRDDEGYFSIVDRLKELIKYKGYQVAPADLEATLLTHPKVADAAVIGVYDDSQATELPRAYVVPKSGYSSLSSEQEREAFGAEVVAWIKAQVASHKQLRGGCIVIEAIPKSPTGKILRKNLRAVVSKEKELTQAGAKGKL